MTQSHTEFVNSLSDEEFPMMLRMQLESTNLEDLPEELRTALLDRASALGINLDPDHPKLGINL